jgi:hypothetical protein
MMRAVLALLAALLGVVSVAGAFATLIASKDPIRAHTLAPWDGRITAQLALKQFLHHQAKKSSPPNKNLARRALVQDPTAVAAVAALGLHAEEENKKAEARHLFAYSQRLTRRDLTTRLWAIEEAVARNDIIGALRHYDIALRTSRRAPEILFPILVNAIADSRIRAGLIDRLATEPPWYGLFIEYAASHGSKPASTALLFRSLHDRGLVVSSVARELLIARLVSGGLLEEAWTYYASFRLNVRRDQARDSNFSDELPNPTLFDWQPIGVNGLSASIQQGLLDVSAPPSVGGALVRQIQMLPAGTYRLTGQSVGIEQPENARPYWLLTCQDGRELGRVSVSNSSVAEGTFSGLITVPASCPTQTLALIARASDSMSGLTGQFDRVQLTR